MKFFVIGDEDTVLGFSLVGISGKTVQSAQEGESLITELVNTGDVGIIMVTERTAELLRGTVDRYMFSEKFPLIVEIPDRAGALPGKKGVMELIREAIGVRI